MIKVFCDKCGYEILDFDAEKNGLDLNYPNKMSVEHWDLCESCTEEIIEEIANLIEV